MSVLCDAVERALKEVQELETLAQSASVDAAAVAERLNALVQRLAELRQAGGTCEGVELPVGVVSDVDTGRNPDTSMSRYAEEASRANQATKGRIQAFQQLRDALEAELIRTQ